MKAIWVGAALCAIGCNGGDTDDSGDDTADDIPTIDQALDCGTMGEAGGLGPGPDLQRYNLDTTAFPDALCNDGTAGFFYFRPHDGSTDQDHWIIQLQGGGSCGNAQDCFDRWCSVDTNFGMQGMTATRSPDPSTGGRGILDREEPTNAAGGFNQVFVRYCSSDGWAGTARDVVLTAAHPVSGAEVTAKIHFEGAAIVDAVLGTLRQDGVSAPVYTLDGGSTPLPDLDDATIVVLGGGSAGGAGTISNGDRVGEMLRDTNSHCQGATCDLEYRLLIDSIFSPDRNHYDFTHSLQCTEGGLCDNEALLTYTREQGSAALHGDIDDESCAAAHTADPWQCTDNGHVVRNHLTSPMFVRMGLTDENISDGPIENGFYYDGAPMDVPTFALLVQGDLHLLADPANAEEGDDFETAPGIFAPTCSKHETLSDNVAIYDVTIDVASTPVHMFQAIGAWRGGTPTEVIASDPSDNYCPPD